MKNVVGNYAFHGNTTYESRPDIHLTLRVLLNFHFHLAGHLDSDMSLASNYSVIIPCFCCPSRSFLITIRARRRTHVITSIHHKKGYDSPKSAKSYHSDIRK